MNHVFEKFQFTLGQREEIIRQIVAKKQDDSMSPHDIRLCWADFLKDKLPPCPWIALIKPNKVVDVLNVEWLQFKASVEPIDDDNSKREECHLKDLFPMKVDDEEKPRIEAASEALDHFRFFISKLWFPWDDDDELNEDNEEDWVTEHLSLRLMALNENSCDDEDDMSETFMKLKTLGRHYQDTNEKLLEGKTADMRHQFALEQKLQNIAKMANITENPNALEEYKSQIRQAKEKERLFDLDRGYSIDRQAVLVWNGGSMNDLQEFMERARKQIPFDDPHILFKNNLQDAIDCCVPNDFIVLGPGDHHLSDLGDLNTCLNIVGLAPDPRKIKVHLDCGFKNEMVFDGPATRCYLNNITLTSNTFQNAIWIKNGGGLEVKDCIFTQCNVAVKASDDASNAKLKWTEFQTCQVALQAEKGGRISFSGGVIEDCHIGLLYDEDDVVHVDDVENYATIQEKTKPCQVRVKIDQV